MVIRWQLPPTPGTTTQTTRHRWWRRRAIRCCRRASPSCLSRQREDLVCAHPDGCRSSQPRHGFGTSPTGLLLRHLDEAGRVALQLEIDLSVRQNPELLTDFDG